MDKQERSRAAENNEADARSAANSTPRRGNPSPVNQMMDQLTRRLPTAANRQARRSRSGSLASRERIAALIAALGDPNHPLHPTAVDELALIGQAAVPALNEVMEPNQPWLTAYRAAEAAGRIGDGRAGGALIRVLQHSNSNVRWSAVRALTRVGDLRAALELRRVAENDQGRTSWGESVAGAAESALAELRSRSVWGQGIELAKTAVTAVLMILALILAFSVTTTLRSDLERFGAVDLALLVETPLLLPTITLTAPLPTALPTPTIAVSTPGSASAAVEPILQTTAALTGTILQAANVRPQPNTGNQPIGQLIQGDEVVFIARSADNQWYLIQLGTRRADSSRINNPDGSNSGWINRALVTPPDGDLPVREVPTAEAAPPVEPSATASP